MRSPNFARSLSILAVLVWLFGSPATAHAATGLPQAPAMNCNSVTDTQYWFCRALQAGDCNLTNRGDYWRCKALVERDCNLSERTDYWTCKALVERNCGLADRAGYWSCRGLVENCDLSPREEYEFCRAVGGYFRTPRT